MEYKGYIGMVEFDDEAGILHGEVVNTRDVITFQGESVSELKTAFQDSVDDYLAFCADRGETPEKPFSGQFVTRIPPELHREITIVARESGMSLNAWVSTQLNSAVGETASLKLKKSAADKAKRKEERTKRSSAVAAAGPFNAKKAATTKTARSRPSKDRA